VTIGQDRLATILAEYEARLRALESAPSLRSASMTDGALEVKDASSQVVLRIGKMSNGEFGVEAIRPDGRVLARLSGTALKFYDPTTGTERMTLDGDRLISLAPDTTGRVNIGTLFSGGYGIEVIHPTSGQWFPLSAVAVGASFGIVGGPTAYSSTAYVVTGPSVSVNVPPTGTVSIEWAAMMNAAVAGHTLYAGLSVDGAAPYDLALTTIPVAGGWATDSRIDQIAGLTPGVHTFAIGHKVGGAGQSVSALNDSLMIRAY
jgi:hypothetical protein